MAGVRLREEEWAGLKKMAENLGETPSRIIRRLVREALNGGPDYFDDGLIDLRRMHRELASIGRNLNQMTKAVNRGRVVNGEEMRAVINAAVVQMEAVKGLYSQAVKAAVKRMVWPLYQANRAKKGGQKRREKRADRDAAIIQAVQAGGQSMRAVGRQFGLNESSVRRILKRGAA